MPFDHIVNCVDLSGEDVQSALQSSDDALALFRHLGSVSAPNTGASKTLLLLARMGTNACLWFDGDLVIDIVGDDDACVIEVMSELAAGMRERIFPSVGFKAKLSEFEIAFDRFPELVFPLAIAHRNKTRLTLRVAEAVRKSTRPPTIRLSESSMLAAPSVYIPKHTPLPTLAVVKPIDDGIDDRFTPEPPTRRRTAPVGEEGVLKKINELDDLDEGWD